MIKTPKGKVRTYKISHNYHVEELQRANGNQERHEAVQQLGTLRRLLYVGIPERLHNLLCTGIALTLG